jgi:hypothetical protein
MFDGEDRCFAVQEPGQQLLSAAEDDRHNRTVIRMKAGMLDYQAFPRRRQDGHEPWTPQEAATLTTITTEIRDRSGRICGWCGASGQLRDWRRQLLTRCDNCDSASPTRQGSGQHRTINYAAA